MLQKNLNLKIRSNMENDERGALKELQKNDKVRVHEFNKGCGFTIATNYTVKEKSEEQPVKATKANVDPTSALTNKVQKNFANLEKKTNLKTRLILNYIHTTPFHHVDMAQSKHTIPKKRFLRESFYPQ